MLALSRSLLLLGLSCSLVTASVQELKDDKALETLFKKQPAVLVEFFDTKDGKTSSVPDDLQAASAASDFVVARVGSSEDVNKKYELTSFPTIKFFASGKAHGEEYDGDRDAEDSSKDITKYAREQLKDAQKEGVLKEKDEVEELRSSRGDRLCFKAQGLCAIFLSDGAASREDVVMLTKLKKKNLSKLAYGNDARGVTFNWSWLDASKEPGFKALLQGDELPGFVIYNPHKRPRHTTLEEGATATEETIQILLDKVTGGDARFTPAKGQKLPAFSGKEEL